MRKKLNKNYIGIVVLLFASLFFIFNALGEGREKGNSNRQAILPKVSQEKKTIPTDVTSSNKQDFSLVNIQAPIIDISGWQLPKEMNYDIVSNQIIGAIVRVQHGGKTNKTNGAAYLSGEDKAYKKHIEEFQKRGVPVAVYAYINGQTVDDMKSEAKAFYDRAEKYNPTYWWVDVEEETMPDMNAGVEAFRSELESLGAKGIGIYTQDWFLSSHNIKVDKFDALWFAHYGADTGFWDSVPETDKKYALHQYTSQGILDGFPRELDLNMVMSMEDYKKIFTIKEASN